MNDVLVILVVEDDLLIQNVLTDTLHDGGYEVSMASSGKEAIKLLDAQNRKYRALLTDIRSWSRPNRWLGSCKACEGAGARPARRLHDRR